MPTSQRQSFDVVAIGDFRFPGGTSAAVAHEIRALHAAGYSVCLVQKRATVLRRNHPINPLIRSCIEAERAVLWQSGVVANELSAKLCVLHNPYVFVQDEAGLPKIDAERCILVAHQPVFDSNKVPYYDVSQVQGTAERLVGTNVVWAPISPLSRRDLEEVAPPLTLLEHDWRSVFFLEDWRVDRQKPVGSMPVIGRHSRPEWQKWPATRADLLEIYPDGPEFDVRLLGVGDELAEIVGRYPENWTTFAFGEVDPAVFLSTIDFFIYYHHPDWTEGFGRAIAEAAASGAVVILPHQFQVTFGEMAIYRRPADVLDTVRGYYRDWERYSLQSRLGQKAVDDMFGPRRYLTLIENLIGKPSSARNAVTAPRQLGYDFDVVQLGDFRTSLDTAWRVAQESEIQSAEGFASGVLHVPLAGPHRLDTIHPAIDQIVRQSKATPIDPSARAVNTRLLIINESEGILETVLSGTRLSLPRIAAEHIIVIARQVVSAKNCRQQDALLRTMFPSAPISWAATDRQTHTKLREIDGIDVESEFWRPSLASVGASMAVQPRRPTITVIGRVGLSTEEEWSANEGEIFSVFPDDEAATVVRIMTWPSPRNVPVARLPRSWQFFDVREIELTKFIKGLDFVAYFPSESPKDVPVTPLAMAMANGVPVVVPRTLESRLQKGPIYAAPKDVQAVIRRHQENQTLLDSARRSAAALAGKTFSPSHHRSRLRRFLGRPKSVVRARTTTATPEAAAKRVLFLSSNGVGVGHLTRLLAIARRLPRSLAPVFVTMSQAMKVVEQAGYPVEYLPFYRYAHCDPNHWNDWLLEQLSQVIEFHRATAVVFDGGMPYGGLIRAVAPRGDVRLVWIRRGMWQANQDNEEAIRRERFFDLVIEPGDIADPVDHGATARTRRTALAVPPIALLDQHELLDREAATNRLGLDPSRPAVLIQLGSGWNRDMRSLVDAVIKACATRVGLQAVIAEWLISDSDLDLWPGVPRLKGFPLSRFYNAFDFTITAAGYNTFNETISFGLPALFIANEHAMLDDQAGRARYAEENGAALTLRLEELDKIAQLIDAMLDEKMRWLIKTNCARLARDNGAAVAADAIAGLLSSTGGSNGR